MWILWSVLLFQLVLLTKAEFGTPYLKNSRLCRPWDCVSRTLGLSDKLPQREYYETVLKSLLSEDWHQTVEKAVDECYNKRHREYVNTCTGQALLHCTLDNLIENCPDNSTRKNDACNPVATTAGMNYMFTQSRYKNLEENLPKEHRPTWFMRQYFDSKCCELPVIVEPKVLSDCGFSTFMRYYENGPKEHDEQKHYMKAARPKTEKGERLVVMRTTSESFEDPLECCDMEAFISPSWRSQCDFKLSWGGTKRFQISDQGAKILTTTLTPKVTTETPLNQDIKVVPLSCPQETCIFKKLNVVSESGVVDLNAFSKVLDNFTTLHPSWNRVKGRVITQCLNKRSSDYSAECQINEVLRCTLDVFSENCPHKSKNDLCRHSRRNNTVCQISSSKYRPKNRRAVCGLPHFVDIDVLTQCGVTSISQIQYVTEKPVLKPTSTWPVDHGCQDTSPSTRCLMQRMGILNKYDFMDYFRMKDRIRSFTAINPEWGALTELYMNVFTALPLYNEYCNSPKKLLNVLDAMLMTCPVSRRKNTRQCKKLFNDIIRNPAADISTEKFEQILQDIQHDLSSATNPSTIIETKIDVKVQPLFDYDTLHSKNVPLNKTVDGNSRTESISEPISSSSTPKINPSTKAPLVLLPVYMRMDSSSTSQTPDTKDGIFKNPSFKLHGRVTSTESLTSKL